jgi:hypothetical protein
MRAKAQLSAGSLKRRQGGVEAVGPTLVVGVEGEAGLPVAQAVKVEFGEHHRGGLPRRSAVADTGGRAAAIGGVTGVVKTEHMAQFMEQDRSEIGLLATRSEKMFKIDLDSGPPALAATASGRPACLPGQCSADTP